MENLVDQEYINTLLSQTTFSYRKFDIHSFSFQAAESIEGNNMEELSNILFPFNPIFCQHIFFITLDDTQAYNKNNYTTLLYCILKCWKFAKVNRINFLQQSQLDHVDEEYFSIESLKDLREQKVSDRKELARALLDYMNTCQLEYDKWKQYDILLGAQSGQVLYSHGDLVNNSIDLAILFIISNDLLKEFKTSYLFNVQTSSITELKISKSPFLDDAKKIVYNADNSNIVIEKEEFATTDVKLGDRIQKNDSDDINRNNVNEIIKSEYEKNDNNILGKEER